MPESVQSCFELSIHFPVFSTHELFLVAVTAVLLYRQMYGKFKTRLDAFWHSYIPPIFSPNISGMSDHFKSDFSNLFC